MLSDAGQPYQFGQHFERPGCRYMLWGFKE